MFSNLKLHEAATWSAMDKIGCYIYLSSLKKDGMKDEMLKKTFCMVICYIFPCKSCKMLIILELILLWFVYFLIRVLHQTRWLSSLNHDIFHSDGSSWIFGFTVIYFKHVREELRNNNICMNIWIMIKMFFCCCFLSPLI